MDTLDRMLTDLMKITTYLSTTVPVTGGSLVAEEILGLAGRLSNLEENKHQDGCKRLMIEP